MEKQKKSIHEWIRAHIKIPLISFLCKHIITLRYTYDIRGIEKFTQFDKKKPGVIAICSHTSLLDGIMVGSVLYTTTVPHAVVVDTYYDAPVFGEILKAVQSVPVPYFKVGSNEIKHKQLLEEEQEVVQLLNDGECVTFFPSSRIKITGEDYLGGKSSLKRILEAVPDVNIVLVRISGFWGSSLSYGYNGKYPNMLKTLKKKVKVILRNGIFFMPRRTIRFEIELPDKHLPSMTRNEINSYLENWFNIPYEGNNPAGEPRTLVPYYYWQKEADNVTYTPPVTTILPESNPDINRITTEIINEISHIANCPADKIHLNTYLERELGIDSLQTSALLSFMEEKYDLSMLNGEEIITVADAVAIASKIRDIDLATVFHMKDKEKQSLVWNKPSKRSINSNDRYNSLFLFLYETTQKNKNAIACGDGDSYPYTYNKLIKEIIDFALALKQLKEEKIGLLFTTTTDCFIILMASILSGKKACIINWQSGDLQINQYVESHNLKHIITSKKFILELNHIKLGDIYPLLITKEKLIKHLSRTQRLLGKIALMGRCNNITSVIQTEI